MIFALTTNAIIVFILYLLKSLYLFEFIVVYILLKWNVFIQLVFLLYLLDIYVFISLYIYSCLLGWILFSFIQYMCYKIYCEKILF